MNLQLVKTEKFNDIACDFYSAEDDIWMTRKQIGEALEYSDPKIALSKIHTAHKDRLDKLSKVTDLVTLDNKTTDIDESMAKTETVMETNI